MDEDSERSELDPETQEAAIDDSRRIAVKRLGEAIEKQNEIIEDTWKDVKRVGRNAAILFYLTAIATGLILWYINVNNLLTKAIGG